MLHERATPTRPVSPGSAARRRAAIASGALVAALGLSSGLAPVATAQDLAGERVARLARLGRAHEIPEGGYLGLVQALRDARNDGVVAIVASHPDDQYLLPAAFLRFSQGYRVVVLLATRGEGGQNSEGPEAGDALARLRTVEVEGSARRLGFVVENLNLPDAGYCRSADEAFELWGRHEAAVAVARALRRVRPDIVLTTHHSKETHGHDLALVEILPDALEVARDPSVEIEGLPPVGVDRLYRGIEPDESAWFALPTDDVDPDRGETYRNLAYAALTASHRSQAPFRPIEEFFGGANLFVGVQLPGAGHGPAPRELHEGLADLFTELGDLIGAEEVDALRATFEVKLPALLGNRPKLAEGALRLRAALLALGVEPGAAAAARLARRIDALERVALHALGVRAQVRSADHVAVPGEPIEFAVEVGSSGPVPIRAVEMEREATEDPLLEVLVEPNLSRPQPWTLSARVTLPDDALRRDPLRDLFRRDRFEMPVVVRLRLSVDSGDGRVAEIAFPLELPVVVRPPIELAVEPQVLLVPDGEAPIRFNVRVRRNTRLPVEDRLRIQVPPGFDAEPRSVELDLRTEPEQGYLFELFVPPGLRPGPQPVRVRLGAATTRVELHRVSVSIPRDLRVGLIEGVDDAARTALSQLGCQLVVLTEAALPTRPLGDLDTILVDIRALNHHVAARAEFNRLLDFAAAGGRLVVLYHKDTEFDLERTGQRFFPRGLPLRIGKGRVTREDAPIEALLPEHPLLRVPNRIGAEDWDGWTQERGLYFASTWAPGYEAVLRTADPGSHRRTGRCSTPTPAAARSSTARSRYTDSSRRCCRARAVCSRTWSLTGGRIADDRRGSCGGRPLREVPLTSSAGTPSGRSSSGRSAGRRRSCRASCGGC